ncbi:hypothetical protein FD754_007601 [Muntiacus muntjak]|uniref:Uncharacterized protein n=1 Tax=Muntiacus muntjak TaxID=9888 RepID=A0A5N3WRQ3_MUNMU|nr:hypothetical protein FD754_007601 [Muntiacus muntjak]
MFEEVSEAASTEEQKELEDKQFPTAAPDDTEVTGNHKPTPQDLSQRKPCLVPASWLAD